MTPEELIKMQFPGRVYITLVEAGRAIGLSAQSCYNLHHLGTFPLPVRKVGRKAMVSLVDLINYITPKGAMLPISPTPKRPRGRPRKHV